MTTLAERLKEVPRRQVLFVIFPNYACQMTGTKYVKVSKAGIVTLTYLDGTTEERKADASLLARDHEDISLFEYTSFVQAGRVADPA
jgi:hypothetical protein